MIALVRLVIISDVTPSLLSHKSPSNQNPASLAGFWFNIQSLFLTSRYTK